MDYKGEQYKRTLTFTGKNGDPRIYQYFHHESKGQFKDQKFAVGDLVMVWNKNTTKSHLPVPQVISVYPGDGGIVRTVKIPPPNEEFIRTSQSLLLLKNSNH